MTNNRIDYIEFKASVKEEVRVNSYLEVKTF